MNASDKVFAEKIYLFLSALFITSLVVSNIIFQKFFYWYPFDFSLFGQSLFEISVGLLPYPLTFLITDLIFENELVDVISLIFSSPSDFI